MKKKIAMICLGMAIAFGVVGCGSGASNNDDAIQENKNIETRVVTDVKGEVEIPVSPERLVDISGASDILSILGYEVIGTANSDAYDYSRFPTYLEETLGNAQILGYSMLAEMDLEAIIGLEPDLIVISTVQEEMYEQLSKVAPVIMIEMKQMDWKEDFMHVASILEKETEASDWMDAYLAKAEAVGTRIKETYGEDTTYLSFLASGESLFLFDGAGLGTILYDDMGLAKPAGMPEQTDISLPVVTFEGLAEISADYFFAVATDEDLQILEASSIWNGIETVKNNQVVTMSASPYFNQGYSPIGRGVFIDEIEELLEGINE